MAGLPHEREHFGRDSLYVQQTLVKAFYLAGRVRDREALPDALTPGRPHGRRAGGVGEMDVLYHDRSPKQIGPQSRNRLMVTHAEL